MVTGIVRWFLSMRYEVSLKDWNCPSHTFTRFNDKSICFAYGEECHNSTVCIVNIIHFLIIEQALYDKFFLLSTVILFSYYDYTFRFRWIDLKSSESVIQYLLHIIMSMEFWGMNIKLSSKHFLFISLCVDGLSKKARLLASISCYYIWICFLWNRLISKACSEHL